MPQPFLDTSVPTEPDFSTFTSKFKKLHPIRSAALFSSLLLVPTFHNNCTRLEELIRNSLVSCSGTRTLTKASAEKLFSEAADVSALYEEVSANLMVGAVHTCKGTFRILEGDWESSGYNLQVFLDVLEGMPNNAGYLKLKNRIYALLKLSDALCERAELKRYKGGEQDVQTSIPPHFLRNISSLLTRVRFTRKELLALGLEPEDLQYFVLEKSLYGNVMDSPMGASLLDRFPLAESGGTFFVLLPTAISVAIRALILSYCESSDQLSTFEMNFKQASLDAITKPVSILNEFKLGDPEIMPLLDESGELLGFEACTMKEGHCLHLVFLPDNFADYNEGFLSGVSSLMENANDTVVKSISAWHQKISAEADFRKGISLIVLSGWGRSIGWSLDYEAEDWQVEGISASDLVCLSSISKMSFYTLLRLFEAKDKLAANGLVLQNSHGLLNLYAWAEKNNFHLVPHDQLSENYDDITPEHPLQVMIAHDFLIEVRERVLNAYDQHVVFDENDSAVLVQRYGANSSFEKERREPFYASLEHAQLGKLVGVIEKEKRLIWCAPSDSSKLERDFSFEIWRTVTSWVSKLFSSLFELLPSTAAPVIRWEWTFDTNFVETHKPARYSYDQLRSFTGIEVEAKDGVLVVTSSFRKEFLDGFHHEENIAEQAMVISFVQGVLSQYYVGKSLDGFVEKVRSEVFTSTDARTIHFLQTQGYRDFITKRRTKSISVNLLDDATFRIGLGWKIRKREEGSLIQGITECTNFLNSLVNMTWLDIRSMLRNVNKESVVQQLLENHETLEIEKTQWERTARAQHALYDDRKEVDQVLSKEIGRRNAAKLGSRIALEMALCECSDVEENGLTDLELTKLLSRCALMFELGNQSDAIKYEMVPAKIKISPVGDILIDHVFSEQVVNPYGYSMQKSLLRREAEKYPTYFKEPEVAPSSGDILEETYLDAWEDEFKLTFDAARQAIDFLEDRGIKLDALCYKVERKDLLSEAQNAGVGAQVKGFLDSFSLYNRERWDNAPSPYTMNDVFPWRFRRRLSAIAKPIIANGDVLIISPGLVREGFVYAVHNSHEAAMEEALYSSSKMRKWIGGKRNKEGHQFNKDVANEFRKVGWKAESDIKLTKLLNKKLPDYGDIDVLAWDENTGRVLLIECKDLETAKTPSEIARQIYDFRGKDNNKGKPDRLKKHLTRIAVIEANLADMKRYLKLAEVVHQPVLLFSQLVPMAFTDISQLQQIVIAEFTDISGKYAIE